MRVLWLSASIVLIDQVTKILVKGMWIPWLGIRITGLPYGFSRPLLGNFVRLTYIENPGMAFGIDVGGKLFFSIFSIVASIAIVVYLYHSRRDAPGFRLALAMILGGAIGNLIDRVFYGILFHEGQLFYGRVVDFLDVDFFDIRFFGHQMNRWPVFNVADAAVTIGVIMLLLFHRKTLAPDTGPVVQTDDGIASGENPPGQEISSAGKPE